ALRSSSSRSARSRSDLALASFAAAAALAVAASDRKRLFSPAISSIDCCCAATLPRRLHQPSKAPTTNQIMDVTSKTDTDRGMGYIFPQSTALRDLPLFLAHSDLPHPDHLVA